MDNVVSDTFDIQVKGRATTVSALTASGMAVIATRRFPRIGQIFDERWLPSAQLPPAAPLVPEGIAAPLRALRSTWHCV
jgi:hypothetical protein